MEIAILGGTGDFGEGLAVRWAADAAHTVVVGSREAERASEAAARYDRRLDQSDEDGTIMGAVNPAAAGRADVVVCSVPAYHLADTVSSVADHLAPGTVLVSPAVGMKRDDDGAHYNRPGAGSVTALAANAAPEGVSVVGAFHNLPAPRLKQLDRELSADTLVVGDDDNAVRTVVGLAEDIRGLRAYRAGPLANAAEVEALSPLLINLATYNVDLDHAVIRFE